MANKRTILKECVRVRSPNTAEQCSPMFVFVKNVRLFLLARCFVIEKMLSPRRRPLRLASISFAGSRMPWLKLQPQNSDGAALGDDD